MADYIADPTNTTQPTEAIELETAAAEFRALKTYMRDVLVGPVTAAADAAAESATAADTAKLAAQAANTAAQTAALTAADAATAATTAAGVATTAASTVTAGFNAATPAATEGTLSAAQEDITLPYAPGNKSLVNLYIDGLRTSEADYSLSGTTLTLATPAVGGEQYSVVLASTTSLLVATSDSTLHTPSGTATRVVRGIGTRIDELEVVVTDHGADATGTSSATTAVNRALEKLVARMTANGSSSGTIKFPPGGRYRLDTAVLLQAEHSGISIDARGATLYKGVADSSSLFRFYGNDQQLLGGTLDGNTAAANPDSSLLLIYGDRSSVVGARFRNSSKNGLAYAMETPGDGTTAPRDGLITNCVFEDNDGVGLSVAGARGLIITNNRIFKSGLEAITLDQGAEYCTVANNYLHSNNLGRRGAGYGLGAGIGVIGYDKALGCKIVGNTFLDSLLRACIRQGNATGQSLGLVITDNIFQNFVDGVDMRGTVAAIAWDADCRIANNTFRNGTNGVLYGQNSVRLGIGKQNWLSVTNRIVMEGTAQAAGTDLEAGASKWQVRKNSNTTNATGNGLLAQIGYDTNANVSTQHTPSFNSGTGAITIAVSGTYALHASVEVTAASTATSGLIEIQANGTVISRRKFVFSGTQTELTMQVSIGAEFLGAGTVLTAHASLSGMAGDTATFAARPLGSEFVGYNI